MASALTRFRIAFRTVRDLPLQEFINGFGGQGVREFVGMRIVRVHHQLCRRQIAEGRKQIQVRHTLLLPEMVQLIVDGLESQRRVHVGKRHDQQSAAADTGQVAKRG